MSKRMMPGQPPPREVGVVSNELLDVRPELRQYAGWAICVPRSCDVAMTEEGVEVLLNNPEQEVEGAEGRYPAVVLSADELRMVAGSGAIEAGRSRSGLRRAGSGGASSNFDSSRSLYPGYPHRAGDSSPGDSW